MEFVGWFGNDRRDAKGQVTFSALIPYFSSSEISYSKGKVFTPQFLGNAELLSRDRVQSKSPNEGGCMRNILLALLLSVAARPLLAQGAPPQGGPDQPYTVEYYYKVRWGHQQEFQALFLKNHYPLLQKVVESGRMLSVKIETPANHMTEDARWDYRVTIRFKNSTMGTTANPDEETFTSSYGLISRLISGRSSGVSRFCWRTGIFH
jgi:hypothetical protein